MSISIATAVESSTTSISIDSVDSDDAFSSISMSIASPDRSDTIGSSMSIESISVTSTSMDSVDGSNDISSISISSSFCTSISIASPSM